MVKEVKQAKNNTVEFTKRIFQFAIFLLALLPVVAGAFTVIHTRNHMSGVNGYSDLFTGFFAVIGGLIVTYKVVMHKEA